MSQNKFGIKTVVHKRLFLNLTKKHGIDPLSAMKTIDALELEKDNVCKINDIRDTTKKKGGLTIIVYKKTIIPNTGQPYEKEVKKLKTYANGIPSRLEYYDSMPGLPERAGGTKPALVEWYPSGELKKETYFKNNVKHRDNGPAEITYDQSGRPVEQKFFTLGVPQEKIEAGKKQEIEFNKKRDEKALANEIARKQKLGATPNERPPAAEPKPQSTDDFLNSVSGSDPEIDKLLKKYIKQEPPVKDNSWRDQSGDKRIDIDLDKENELLNPNPISSLFTQKSEKKTPLESPNTNIQDMSDEDDIDPRVPDNMAKKKNISSHEPQVKDKGLYSKIIDNIAKFLTKKHKEKLTPETLKKIQDYYTSKVQKPKQEAPVQKQYKKEYTGRRREEFPLAAGSKKIDSEISESIFNEVIELTEALLEKYKDKLF